MYDISIYEKHLTLQPEPMMTRPIALLGAIVMSSSAKKMRS